jgi:hypothetical protein
MTQDTEFKPRFTDKTEIEDTSVINLGQPGRKLINLLIFIQKYLSDTN